MIPQRRGAADAAIARLEVRVDRVDPLAARLAVERILGAVELRPDCLPPSAILCVRELRDPRPGTLSLGSLQLQPSPVWEQAVRREVDRLARAAARPVHGGVPAAAEAVVFADESELLACLGSDLLAGMVGARWWWRLLVGGVDQPRRAAVDAWLRAPEHVPAALQVLAARHEAEAFVRLLDDRHARDLHGAVAKAFGLPATAAGGDTVRGPRPEVARVARPRPGMAPVEAGLGHAGPGVGQAGAAAELPVPSAPWSAVAPEADRAGLSIEQRALLGTALTLARAPVLARDTGFAIELAAWRAAATEWWRPRVDSVPDLAPRVHRTAPSIAPASLSRLDRAAEPAAPTVDASAPHDAGVVPLDPATGRATRPAPGVAPAARGREAAARWSLESTALPAASDAATAPPAAEEPAVARSEPAGEAPLPADAPQPSSPAPRRQPATRARRPGFGPPVRTRLGGLFYLVNLALYLRLYGEEANLPLPLWDLVALVGRALLGDAAVLDDPVWDLLAELAGRSGDEPPGAGFTPPPDWRLPPAWLAGFEVAPALVHASPDRLVIAHAEGFAIVDVESQSDPASQLATELASYGLVGAPAAVAASLASDADAALDRWLARLLPYLRARLRRVLAVDDAGLPALLLVHPARVHVTDAHVDVVLSLDTLPIELRVAGLDRDPGWVAAAGRFIAFHFE